MIDQISPLLVEALTGEPVEDQVPVLSMLGSENVKKVARLKHQIDPVLPVNNHKLTCLSCGREGSYNVGLIFLDPEQYGNTNRADSKKGDFQTTGYFRCNHCNEAGQWKTSSSIEITMITALIKMSVNQDWEDGPVQFGKIQLFDGSSHQWSTDREEYLLKKIANGDGDLALLWNKLGNAYYKGGRPELAVAAFEKSLSIDKKFVESHYSMGDILYKAGDKDQAIDHYRNLLIYSHEYDKMDPVSLRNIIADALQDIWDMKGDIQSFLSFLPKANEILGREDELHHVVEMEIFQEDRESLFPFAEMYMGKENAKRLPLHKRTLVQGKIVEEKSYFIKKKKKKRKKR